MLLVLKATVRYQDFVSSCTLASIPSYRLLFISSLFLPSRSNIYRAFPLCLFSDVCGFRPWAPQQNHASFWRTGKWYHAAASNQLHRAIALPELTSMPDCLVTTPAARQCSRRKPCPSGVPPVLRQGSEQHLHHHLSVYAGSMNRTLRFDMQTTHAEKGLI